MWWWSDGWPVQNMIKLAGIVALAALMLAATPARPQDAPRGRLLYETHCLPCHGGEGHGDGPVGQKYVPQPMNLATDYVQQQPDGQLWYTITWGGVVMPFYHDAIVPADRWHVVNYLKHGLVPR